jgi:acetyl esterase/lipase
MAHIARHLAQRGYVARNICYRLAPANHYPAPVEDLREAHGWMRRNALSLHVCADQIGVLGYPAGGHLAALVGGMDAPSKDCFQAVVAGGAPTDMRKFADGLRVTDFMGGTRDKMAAVYAEASPITHISADDPPVFLYHGGSDQIVPTDHAKDYYEALQRAGVQGELFWLEKRGHVSAFLSDEPAITAAIDFLDRHLATR